MINISLKSLKVIHVLLLLSTCVLLFSLYITFFREKNITSTSKNPTTILYPTRNSTSGGRLKKMRDEADTNLPVSESLAGFKTISNTCSDVKFPYKQLQIDRWQNVDTDNNDFVFSAYKDEDKVKVIGASSLLTGNPKLWCQLWYLSTDTSSIEMVTIPSDRFVIGGHHDRRYVATFFTCYLPREHGRRIVKAVSITNSTCTQPLNVLPVTQNYGNGQSDATNQFTICVAPLHEYYKAYQLVEWIELNRILGADKFIFYNFSISTNVGKVLKSYVKDDLVEVIDWNLTLFSLISGDGRVRPEIHTYAQLAAINDCLLRSRGRSEFIVKIDVDEFIIPRGENVTTWKEMLEQMPKENFINAPVVFKFTNKFFRKEWNDSRMNFSGHEQASEYRLATLLWLHRENKTWGHNMRAKYICRTNHVQEIGVHTVNRFMGDKIDVSPDVGLLQHYRVADGHQESIEDDTMIKKYKDKLLRNVRKKWKNLPGVSYGIPS